MKSLIRLAVATVIEFSGTFIMVTFGLLFTIGAKLYMPGFPPMVAFIVGAIGFGIPLGFLVAMWGHRSGAHFNPAVTLGLTLTGQFPPHYMFCYLVSQSAGAYFAVRFVRYWVHPSPMTLAGYGAPALSAATSVMGGAIREGFGAFVLTSAVAWLTLDDGVEFKDIGKYIGAALFAALVITSRDTGGGVNPARAIAAKVEAGTWDPGVDIWVYIVGPVNGAIAAVLLFLGIRAALNKAAS